MITQAPSLLAELEKAIDQISTGPFVTAPDLLQLNIFGSRAGLHRAVRLGRLKLFRVSGNRHIFLKSEVLRFLVDSEGMK